jgi:hypothetical protein
VIERAYRKLGVSTCLLALLAFSGANHAHANVDRDVSVQSLSPTPNVTVSPTLPTTTTAPLPIARPTTGPAASSSSSSSSSGGAAPTVNAQQFLNNPLGQPGGVGNAVVGLLTTPNGGLTPQGIAQALAQTGGLQANLQQATQIVTNIQGALQTGQMTPQMGANLATALAGNMLSPQALQGLTSLPNVGNIVGNAQGIQQIFSNPVVQSFLGANANNPLAQAGFIDQMLTGALQGGAQAITSQGIQALTQQIGTNAPQLAQALESLGGTGGIANALGQVIANPAGMLGALTGGGAGGIAGVTGGAGGTGGGGGRANDSENYELASKATELGPGGHACGACQPLNASIANDYKKVRQKIKDEFIKHRSWIVNTYWLEHVLPALMRMANQLTVIGIAQVEMIGAMLDAKHQMETQRLFQQMMAQAHKDYHPSEGMCTFGTSVRSLAASERKSDLTQIALAGRMMQRQTMSMHAVSGEGMTTDSLSRIKHFLSTYCQKTDNAGILEQLCINTDVDPERLNIDIDFTRNVESRLTLDLDLTEDTGDIKASIQEAEKLLNETPEENVDARRKIAQNLQALNAEKAAIEKDRDDLFALSANLFAHTTAARIPSNKLALKDGRIYEEAATRYMDLRAIFAKRSVAQNSFAALTAMRSSGDEGSAPYTKALIKELGITSEDEINKLLGEKPSYFAQMEVLTKKIYQNPSFYTQLYDKPVNVARKGAAIEAISLMQDRDLYNSLLRSEAVLSVLLETMLMKEQSKVINTIPEGMLQ